MTALGKCDWHSHLGAVCGRDKSTLVLQVGVVVDVVVARTRKQVGTSLPSSQPQLSSAQTIPFAHLP